MASCLIISGLSTGIWDDIGAPSSLSVSSIESKLLSSGFMGQFDVLVNGCHYLDYQTGITGYCIAPSLSSDEQSIYRQLYLTNYYLKRSHEIFSLNNGLTAGAWVEIKEGDSTIRRSNPTEIVKILNASYIESKKALDQLIDSYKKNDSGPRSVDYYGINQ